jgi:hypothetical protein
MYEIGEFSEASDVSLWRGLEHLTVDRLTDAPFSWMLLAADVGS